MEKDGNKVIAIDVKVEQNFCAFYRENGNSLSYTRASLLDMNIKFNLSP